MADLKTVIAKLASNLAAEVVAAVRHMSLDELAGLDRPTVTRPIRRRRGRPRKTDVVQAKTWGDWGPRASKRPRVRRSPAHLQKLADRIVAIVKAHPNGINAEDIKTKMGIRHGNVGAKVFTKPLAVALASKEIRKSGIRRGTRYFAA
jgi:hypothetical protein